jgi:hypothetical protein
MKVLSTNPKVDKGEAVGVATYILHLAPWRLSGYNVCPCASTGCAGGCLNVSGRGGIPDGSGCVTVTHMLERKRFTLTVKLNNIQRARIKRTRRFFEDRASFLRDLVRDIEKGVRNARRDGMVPAFRLNGTSDLRWEVYPVERDGQSFANIFEAFPDVQFYDYTKIPNRRNIPANYHLTFSLSESNDAQALQAIRAGLSVAVPMWAKKGEALPDTWGGFRAIDGDVTDVRFRDPRGVIVALRAKGRPDRTNRFIRNVDAGFRALPTV